MRKIERINADAQIQVLEKDRARIANDMHDELAPLLAAVKMKINAFDLVNDIDKQRLLNTNGNIDELAKRMRAISFDLMPYTLYNKGLKTAILEFLNYLGSEHNLRIRFIASTDQTDLYDQRVIHIYRMVQEIIHNTIKHARATELVISLDENKKHFILSTSDNGVGFDYRQRLKNSDSLGLKGLMNRIYVLKGEFAIDSTSGRGTNIIIRIPKQHD